jgi:flagellar biosynthesis/type III secretory pathway chaperone
MDSNADRRLEAVLDREIEVARRLAATLSAEREALTSSSPGAVSLHAAEKVALFASFEELECERQRFWDPARHPAEAPVAVRWKTLMEIMAQCRKANEINGYIINVRRGQVRQLIDVVRGGAPLTYGPEGKTGHRALRALARA